ncbi:MAG: FxsA family protein [Alkalispirochaetaceae bacterium]
MRIDQLFDRGTLARLVSLLLILSILGLADGYLLVQVARWLGVYLALAAEGAVAILALGIVGTSILSKLRRIRRHISFGRVPTLLYGETLVLLISLGLLIAPGFITDALGIVFFIIPLRTFFAWTLSRIWREQLNEAHEYLKMRVFSDRS